MGVSNVVYMVVLNEIIDLCFVEVPIGRRSGDHHMKYNTEAPHIALEVIGSVDNFRS